MATSGQNSGPSPKGYNIEKTTVMVKKKKLKLDVSYGKPLDGYTFLPIGTPELADRCKELSRQRGLVVYIAHARPNNTNQTDPLKVSHHSNRIGYHFRTDVLDEASRELRYIMHGGHFVKEADHKAKFRQEYIHRVLERHGIHMERTERLETPQEVIEAIKELFPRIPDEDLNQVVDRAWSEGSGRVGNNADLPLARRVQLAVIARIRHVYTDYDGLLRAFGDWKGARREVEYKCLQKLIEWRGEHDVEDDDALEAMLVDLISFIQDEDEERNILEGERNMVEAGPDGVIDLTGDDVVDLTSDGEADDEDTSDASIEHGYQRARGGDPRRETVNEGSTSHLGRSRPLPPPQTLEQRKLVVRQLIEEARRSTRQPPPSGASSTAAPMRVTTDGRNDVDCIAIGDELYVRESAQPTNPRALLSPPRLTPTMTPRASDNASQGISQSSPMFIFKTEPGSGNEMSMDAVPSIEPHVPVSDPALPSRSPMRGGLSPLGPYLSRTDPALSSHPPMHHGPPTTHGDYRPMKRRRVQYSPDHVFLSSDGLRGPHPQNPRGSGEVRMYDRPPPMHQPAQIKPEPIPYDPTQPMLDLPMREARNEMRVNYREPPSGLYTSQPKSELMPPYESAFRPLNTTQLYNGGVYPPSNHQRAPQRFLPMSTHSPQPIHGAPAPVQQVPLGLGNTRAVPAPTNTQPFPTSTNGPQRPSVLPPLPPGWQHVPIPPPDWPLNGAPPPAQYFAPR